MGIQTLSKGLFCVLAGLVVLTGCGLTVQQQTEQAEPFPTENRELIFQVEINDSDTILSIQEQYTSEVIAWIPEDGLAILTGNASTKLSQLNVLSESNIDAVSIVQANSAFASGVFSSGTFASGVFSSGTFASGVFASGVFSSGVNESYLQHNEEAWKQVELFDAHLRTQKLGQGVKIAVIDTGVDVAHYLLDGSFSPISEWKDYVDADLTPNDELGGSFSGHGTAVTGLILQVAPKSEILPIRVLDTEGAGNMGDLVSAIMYAVDQGADVINLSLGTNNYSGVLATALRYAKKHGVYVAVAAGNQGSNAINYPAKMSSWGDYRTHLFAIASVDNQYQQSWFTNWGGETVASAPGEAIQTTYPGDKFVNATGTSFSTPIVAGAIALLHAENPSANVKSELEGSVQFPHWKIEGTISIDQFLGTLSP